MSIVYVGTNAVSQFSKRLKNLIEKARLRVDEDTWPPNLPKTYTPLVLVHHQDKYTAKQADAMATCIHSGYIDEVVSESVNPGCCNTEITKPAKKTINTSKITKDISDILNIPLISDSTLDID